MNGHDKRITVQLSREEFEALSKSAQDELRHPRDQARHILRRFLLDEGGAPVLINSKSGGKVSEASATAFVPPTNQT